MRIKSAKVVGDPCTSDYLPVKTVTICVPVQRAKPSPQPSPPFYADCFAQRATCLRCVTSPADSGTRLRPILQVARRVMPPVACGILPGTGVSARMRVLEGGCDVLNWVCVRRIRPHVWSVLVGTIPVAMRLRVGRAGGRRLAAMAQTRGSSVSETGRCVICAPRLHRNWVLIRMGKT